MKQKLLIGIDGGGTHSTAVAAWPDGRVAAVAYGGGMNFHNIGIKTVRVRLEDMVAELCEKGGAEAEKICVGLSALDAPADEETLDSFATGTLRKEQLDLQSDAYIALMGFTLGTPGVIVICGTGSMLLMMDRQGTQHASGGWGYLLGDAGSGYTLAREALLAAIDYAEGLGEATPLLQDVLTYLGIDVPRGIIKRVYDPAFTPDQQAGFARMVLARAQEGDPVACRILSNNMKRLARYAGHAVDTAPEAVCVGLYGGIFAHSEMARQLFTDALHQLHPEVRVKSLEYPPELGALIHLFSQQGTLTPEVLSNLKTTYEEYCHECH